MARRIYIKDGGLNTSSTIPPGYTALGSDSGDLKKKVVDTVSDVGGGSGGYKVYTALLTQSGGDDFQEQQSGLLTIGVTYYIDDNASNPDFTNVGAANNNVGTYFMATGTTPTSWGEATLAYNTGAPVVKVLENTIGNIWFIYETSGQYTINSNGLFLNNKTFCQNSLFSAEDGSGLRMLIPTAPDFSNNYVLIYTVNFPDTPSDDLLINTPIEIRVYN